MSFGGHEFARAGVELVMSPRAKGVGPVVFLTEGPVWAQHFLVAALSVGLPRF